MTHSEDVSPAHANQTREVVSIRISGQTIHGVRGRGHFSFPLSPRWVTQGPAVSKPPRITWLERTRPTPFSLHPVFPSDGFFYLRGHRRSTRMLRIWVLDERDLRVACAAPSEVLLGQISVGEHKNQAKTRGFGHGVTIWPDTHSIQHWSSIIRTGNSWFDTAPSDSSGCLSPPPRFSQVLLKSHLFRPVGHLLQPTVLPPPEVLEYFLLGDRCPLRGFLGPPRRVAWDASLRWSPLTQLGMARVEVTTCVLNKKTLKYNRFNSLSLE